MTRYTNLGHKRTYVQAGFHDETTTVHEHVGLEEAKMPGNDDGEAQPPAKKKRKRSKHKKGPAADDTSSKDTKLDGEPAETVVKGPSKKQEKKAKFKAKQAKDAAARATASEQRRLKRVEERNSHTVCFACRKTGHTAKDCQGPESALEGDDNAVAGRSAVGMCYRCGSNKHTLSRCRKPVNSANPLPFALCFVCSGKGHLASSCPKNKDRGVYPNGGSCKLCGETSHLAKDCGLRIQQPSASTIYVGSGQEAGADEDDFHILKRKTAEVDKEERDESKTKRLANIKAGALTGIVKSFPKIPAAPSIPRKVVNF
ncbi:hypothetical protein BD410DRAFT_767502 [Rickenella mellea]|uniref:CCHC-type domain-containing protein n=1 Tax=Rickenella mellea TaxID=50990 RepID=A0A4Y7Q9L6_9AGAM|nr:hypothetical protein BD410DRAFT_767502 [Rickenella mellea]